MTININILACVVYVQECLWSTHWKNCKLCIREGLYVLVSVVCVQYARKVKILLTVCHSDVWTNIAMNKVIIYVWTLNFFLTLHEESIRMKKCKDGIMTEPALSFTGNINNMTVELLLRVVQDQSLKTTTTQSFYSFNKYVL